METNVSTKVTKIDLKTILNNYREPEFWNKQWTIMDTREISIVWKMSYIDVENGFIKSKLIATKTHIVRGDFSLEEHWVLGHTCTLPSIPFNRSDYTQEQFENTLYTGVIHLLESIETHCIYYYDDYCMAERKYQDDVDKYTTEANCKLDELREYDEQTRKLYIDAYVGAAIRDSGATYTCDVIEHYRHHIIPDSYKFVASLFDRSDELAKFYSMNMSTKGPHTKEIDFDGINF